MRQVTSSAFPAVPPRGRRRLSDQELRERQLRILDAIAVHCDALGLRYYLCAGTLLGAVRHGGYIPWDDDIDVMLPRPDWERLCATFPDRAADASVSDLSIRSLSTSPTYALPFAKVCDDATELDVESDIIRDIGIYVDVFPLDGWADGKLQRRLQHAAMKALTYVIRVKHLQRARRRAWWRDLVLAIGKALLLPISARLAAQALTRVGRSVAFDTSAEAGIVVWGYHEVVPRHCYGTAGRVSFEGRELPAPADTDCVLRVIYGDYMQLPPPDKRITHHRFTAYALDGSGRT